MSACTCSALAVSLWAGAVASLGQLSAAASRRSPLEKAADSLKSCHAPDGTTAVLAIKWSQRLLDTLLADAHELWRTHQAHPRSTQLRHEPLSFSHRRSLTRIGAHTHRE